MTTHRTGRKAGTGDLRASALLRGSALALAIKALGAVVAFGLHVLIARATAPATYGLYLFVLGWVGLAALCCRFGTDTLTVRWVAHYRTLQTRAAAEGFIVWVRRRLWLQIAVVVVSVGGLVVSLRSLMSPPMWYAVWAAGPLAVIMVWNSHFRAVAQGLGRVWAFAPEQLVRPLLFVPLIGLYVGSSSARLEAWQLFALSTIAAAGALVLAWLGARGGSAAGDAERSQQQEEDWRKAQWPLFFVAAANVVLSQTDVLMLGMMMTQADVGIYGAAARIVVLTTFGLAAVNTYMAPEISRLYGGGEMGELQRSVTSSARLVAAFTVLVVAFLALFADWILGLFGPQYLAAGNALRILLVGQLVGALAGSVGYLQTMTGQERQAARVIVVAALINIGLNALLIPRYGIEGAAVATAAALIVWRWTGVWLVHRRIGVRSTVV